MSKTKSLSFRVKRACVVIHLWLGLTIGLIWAIQGFTGALLVFHREADKAALAAPPPGDLPLDTLLTLAARTQSSPPESIGLYFGDLARPNVMGVVFTASQGGKKTVLVSTSSGAILADRDRAPSLPKGNLARWIYNLHHFMLLGETGGMLVGISGLFLLTGALTGLWLGWPKRRYWRATFAPGNWRTRLQKLFGWHRASGLLVTVALVLLALSGAAMSFGKQLREIAPRFVPYRPAFMALPGLLPQRPIGADEAVRVARKALSEARFVSVSLPGKSPVYQVRLRMPDEWRTWSGTSVVTVSATTGQVLDVYDATRAPLANKLLESAFAVHSGEVAGLAGRLLTLIAGLFLSALYVTGVWAWLRKRRLRKRKSTNAGETAHIGYSMADISNCHR